MNAPRSWTTLKRCGFGSLPVVVLMAGQPVLAQLETGPAPEPRIAVEDPRPLLGGSNRAGEAVRRGGHLRGCALDCAARSGGRHG